MGNEASPILKPRIRSARPWRTASAWAMALALAGGRAVGQETDPGRAPTGSITAPGDLLREADGTEFRFGYFPSHDRLRLRVLCPSNAFTRWSAVLTPAGGGASLQGCEGTLPMAAGGVSVRTPPLPDGTYAIALTLSGEGDARREIRRTFERRRFPWETLPVGLEREVIPPFTPLAVDERMPRVACVLREHDLDGNGLWRQVTSQGHPLLSSPMRIEVQSTGRVHVARGPKATFTEKAPDRVRGHAAWKAGPVGGRTEFTFDYDGLMKIELHLEPAAERVDALRLVIPMKTAEARLMHPVTDLLRFHYAGRIPEGKGLLWDYGGQEREVRYTDTGEPDSEGKVWDSRHVGRHHLPGPFVPYLWVGGPERGLCWFAESDRDWSLDPQIPAMEIRRRGDTTELVVRLVTRPVVLTRPRTIAFGLMATPAKPMPSTPVNFRRWFPGAQVANTSQVVNFGFMGACYYWGAAGPCYAFYPAFKNFAIYDEFARLRKGGAADFAYTDAWLRQFRAPEFQPHLDTYRNHINWSLRFFDKGAWGSQPEAGRTGWVIPYVNARAINWGEEAATFLDEWSTVDIADPRWPGEERFVRAPDGRCRLAAYGKVAEPGETSGIAYAVDPVPSWQNMVLFYHRRMLETFADGIYLDDYFLSPSYDPFGPGYVDEEGRLHAGVRIFAFHDLTKRIAVMQHRMGRRPLVFIHMTNVHIVPMLSFGTIILDHEWRDQGDFRAQDCQQRLNLDRDTSLLLAQSTGLQSGCLGVWHNLFHGDERLNRSALGVALTHEIKFGLWYGPLHERTTAALADFGYGLPDCRVWRYWDEAPPVRTTGASVKSLVLARDGRAMLVVASYGEGGEAQLDLDLAPLGLPDDAEAADVETGERLERIGPGRFRLRLPTHDFRLVRVGGPAP